MAITDAGSRLRVLGPAAIGRANRSRVLELLHRNGPCSRAQLARELNVNRATVTSIVQPLLDNGTLMEGASLAASPNGGKPGRPLWFNQDGLELGSMRISANAITVARLGVDGTIHAQRHGELDSTGALAQVEGRILELAGTCFDGHRLLGIGVAASGMVDTTVGQVISLHLAPVFNGYPLGDVLQRRFGVPVTVDHHPRVQALGDKWFGAGRRLTSFASVYTGEALGFGIVHDGEIIRGQAGAGGEYGHMVVDMHGAVCLCGRRGCWETVATLGWLRGEAESLGLPAASEMDCGRLSALAARGDRAADELLHRYARNVVLGMANNEYILGSGTYIVHGDVCRGGERMRELLHQRLVETGPHRGAPPTVIMSSADDEMTLLGGGGLVLSAALTTVA